MHFSYTLLDIKTNVNLLVSSQLNDRNAYLFSFMQIGLELDWLNGSDRIGLIPHLLID